MTSFKIPPPQHGLDLVDGLVRRLHWRVLRVFSVLSPPIPLTHTLVRRAMVGEWGPARFCYPAVFYSAAHARNTPTTNEVQGGRPEEWIEGGAACMRSN